MNAKPEIAFLKGQNVLLRPLELSDVGEDYLSWLNAADQSRHLPSLAFPSTMNGLERYVRTMQETPGVIFLAICELGSGRHVGNIKLGPIDWVARKAEFGIMIGAPESRSKGYGSEAVRLVVDYAFDSLNLNRVTAGCLAANKGARRCYEKAGLRVEGTLRQNEFVCGQYEDGLRMGILKQDRAQAD